MRSGNKAEARFKRVIETRGARFSTSSPWQDSSQHIDGFVDDRSYDVKAMKKVGRGDHSSQDALFWMELHGVREKDLGWLYGGKASHIAFEVTEGFVIVPRAQLAAKVEQLVDREAAATSAAGALHKVYRRPGRFDELTLLTRQEVETCEGTELMTDLETHGSPPCTATTLTHAQRRNIIPAAMTVVR